MTWSEILYDLVRRAGENTGTLIRYLLLLTWLGGLGWLLLNPYLEYVHQIVAMLLDSPDTPRPLLIIIAVAVLGMPAVLFRPRISVRLVRALATLLRRGNNDGNSAP
jgi:hypothetical protein